jgi:hypothetical protein
MAIIQLRARRSCGGKDMVASLTYHLINSEFDTFNPLFNIPKYMHNKPVSQRI